MKKIYAVLLFLVATFLCSVSYGADRFEYFATAPNGDVYYLDTQSIAYTNTPDIIRFWAEIVESDSSRKERIAEASNKGLKNMYRKLSHTDYCFEINFQQNTYRFIEIIYRDADGRVLDSSKHTLSSWEGWNNISPKSMIEAARDVVLRIIQSNTQRTPRQPFVAPQPQPQPRQLAPQPQMPLSNQQQREEYGKLLEYVSWLIAQQDYPEFEAWVSLKAQQAGLSLNDLSSGIEEYVRQSGGRYSDIRAMLAGWYREFYMERYGGR